MLRKLCGIASLEKVLIATTRWSEVSFADGEAYELELMSSDLLFKPASDKGAILKRYHDTTESAHDVLRVMIKGHPQPLSAQVPVCTSKIGVYPKFSGIVDVEEQQLEQHDSQTTLYNKQIHDPKGLLEVLSSESTFEAVPVHTKWEMLIGEYQEEKRRSDARIKELIYLLDEERYLSACLQRSLKEFTPKVEILPLPNSDSFFHILEGDMSGYCSVSPKDRV